MRNIPNPSFASTPPPPRSGIDGCAASWFPSCEAGNSGHSGSFRGRSFRGVRGQGFRGRGFTLTELLVAIGITVLMISLVGRILVESSNATAMGMALSEVIATGRTTAAQFRHDARHMVGPGGLTAESNPRDFEYSDDRGGFLIVINDEISASFPDGSTQTVRSDQVLFVREGHGETALTPSRSGRYDNDLAAPYLLVWYGHGQPVDPQNFGESDSLGSGANALAPDFPLARQALQLYERQMPSGRWHMNGGRSTSEVQNGPGRRFDGTCDVARASLHNPSSEAGEAGLLVVGSAESDALLRAGAGDYGSQALGFAFPDQRLRLLLRPQIGAGSLLPPEAIARMHPLFARGVSEFEVAMAMDDGNGRPQRDGDNNIIWYDMHNPHPDLSQAGGGDNVTSAWVFRHDDYEDSDWPHLLRLRYRVHDREDRLTDGEGNTGRWFEQVIPVTRP